MATSGAVIYAADYNTVWLQVNSVLGNGFPQTTGFGSTYGYNQTLTSSYISGNPLVTANQFQLLNDDINKISLHQTNGNFSGYSATYETTGFTIYAANLNTLSTAMTSLLTNRTTVSASQLTSTGVVNTTVSQSWGGSAATTTSPSISSAGTIVFASAAAMQYYFNQGGKFVFTGQFPGYNAAQTQDVDWNSLTGLFNYTIDVTELAALTGTSASRYQINMTDTSSTGTVGYTANFIRVTASVTAATISVTVLFQDDHAPQPTGFDQVSAGTGFIITRYTASGAFSGTNPTVTFAAIA